MEGEPRDMRIGGRIRDNGADDSAARPGEGTAGRADRALHFRGAEHSVDRTARGALRRALVLVSLVCLTASSGCLSEPDEEDLWTRLDILSVEPLSHEKMVRGETMDVAVHVRATYRSILTGTLALEIRETDRIGYGEVRLEPDADRNRLAMSHEVYAVLEDSRVLASATRNVTGWDHLVHEMNFEFQVTLPVDTGRGGLFVIFYLGEGEDVELPSGEEITVVNAFDFEERHILPDGMELVAQ